MSAWGQERSVKARIFAKVINCLNPTSTGDACGQCESCRAFESGTIETLIARDKMDRKKMAVVKENGREAITDYEVVERFGKYTLVRCKLRTGRTHQIRVHMEYLGYPLVGDPKYSPMKTPFAIKGQALHSQTLEFTHPRTGKRLCFEAPLPEDMHKIITRLHLGQFN